MNDFLFILAIIIAAFLFAGEPDIADAIRDRLQCDCCAVQVEEGEE